MSEEYTERLAENAARLEASDADHERLRAEHERLEAEERSAEANALWSEANARKAADRSHALEARAEALQAALDEARARAGVERLAGLAGVLGTLADVVEIDDGCQRGFEAAVDDVLGTVVVEGTSAARDALHHLHGAGLHGGVLPTGGSQVASPVPGSPPAEALPDGAELLRDRVRSGVRGVDAVLDQLLAGVLLCRDGLIEALRIAEALPNNTIVTTEGDRLSARGWRVGAARSGATRAALEAVLRDAESALGSARAAASEAEADRAALAVPGRRPGRPVGSSTTSRRRCAQLRASEAQSAELLSRLAAERDDVCSAHEAAVGRLIATEAEVALRETELARAEGAELEALATVEEATRARKALDDRARSLAAREPSSACALPEWRSGGPCSPIGVTRWSGGSPGSKRLARRPPPGVSRSRPPRWRSSASPLGLGRLGGELTATRDRLREACAERELAVTRAATHLRQLRDERSAAEHAVTATRELVQRVELERAEAKLRLETGVEALRRDLECEPEEAIAAPCPELPPGVPAPARVRELDRELRLMGPVNPLALEELAALEERDRFLERAARRRSQRPAGAGQRHPGGRRGDRGRVHAGLRRRRPPLRRACSRCSSPAAPGASASTIPTTCSTPGSRSRPGPPGQQRAPAVAAVGRRAVARRARVPLRGVPQPAVALLPDGRGRGGARRREPAPVPRPRRRVPGRGTADRRESPEADDGGSRRPLRRDHAARRGVEGRERADRQPEPRSASRSSSAEPPAWAVEARPLPGAQPAASSLPTP